MYYYLNINKFKKIDPKKKYISMLTIDELKDKYIYLNISKEIINYFEKSNNFYEIHSNYNLSIISIKNINKEIFKFGLYISKNIIIIIIINNYYKVPNISNINELKGFLAQIIENNLYILYSNLEELENKINYIEKEILKNNMNININKTLFSIKRHISYLKRCNENYLFFIENIINNITNKNTHNYIKNIESKIKRLNHNYEYLIDNILQLHDIYTLNVDYSQNKIIKSLTIISSIFLPLSLITGWYGMNFKYMPELNYKYSYFFLIIIITIIILIIVILLKKKKII